jgi:hypothetical protein
MPVSRRGTPVLDEDGKQRMIHRPVLTDAAKVWRNDVQLLCQNARPPRWKPQGQIRVVIDLFLAHDMDCDNTGKLLLDGLAKAIEYDDIHFLVTYRSKEAGVPLRDARVVLTIDDDTARPY